MPALIMRRGGQLSLIYRPSKMLRKKDEILHFPANAPLRISRFQPFFKFVNTNGSKLVRCLLVDQGYLEVNPDSDLYDVLWTGKHIKKSQLQAFNRHQKINHFPRTYELTRKDRLFKNVEAMQKKFPNGGFDFLPKTYVLPEEHELLRKHLHATDERWILKPNSSSRGRGIFIIRDLLDVSPQAMERCVVCRYIDNPLLINGLKFDLRIYVAVTSFFPLRVYIYEEGLARFATESYREDGFKNPFIHLTNYSINKKSAKFSLLNQSVEDDEESMHEATGSKWTLTAFRRFLRENKVDDRALWKRIEHCVARSLLSIEDVCATATQDWAKYRGSCFELFGFDVLLDDNLKPWVLEVNLSPSLSVESSLDFGVKTNMISDLFNLVGFNLFDRTTRTAEKNLAPFSDAYTQEDLDTMVQETKEELDRAGGWKMLVPARDDSLDEFYATSRRGAYEYIRDKLN